GRPARALLSFPTRRSSDLKDSDEMRRYVGDADRIFPPLHFHQINMTIVFDGAVDLLGDCFAALCTNSEVFFNENAIRGKAIAERSEEHTSELQSPCNIVCR